MNKTKIISPLNDVQRKAVCAPTGSMLILAGAGSGKTRVLVHRIAWMIKNEGIAAQNILAVTFTNKAAKEMHARVEQLLNISTHGMWIGTFHGLAHRLLKRHAQVAKLPNYFQIIDSSDQLRIIKRLSKSLNLDNSECSPRQIQYFINQQKDQGFRAKKIVATDDDLQRQMMEIYQSYEGLCQRSGLVDFAELLLRAYELLNV